MLLFLPLLGRRRCSWRIAFLAPALMPPASGTEDTVYEYKVNEVSGEWEHWGAKVPEWAAQGDVSTLSLQPGTSSLAPCFSL